MMVPRAAAILLFLIVLTIQITGLSCLEEWKINADTTVSQASSALDDDCPCHLAFVSSTSSNFQGSKLVKRLGAPTPVMYAFGASTLPFHPPLSA
jgi:hypothetical protein